MSDAPKRIAALNDALRKSPLDCTRGKLYMTDGVNAHGPTFVARAIAAMIAFDDFNTDNDPYHEHDFGAFDHKGDTIYWKIDYYDRTLTHGSEDPSDARETMRVLTIMLASEW